MKKLKIFMSLFIILSLLFGMFLPTGIIAEDGELDDDSEWLDEIHETSILGDYHNTVFSKFHFNGLLMGKVDDLFTKDIAEINREILVGTSTKYSIFDRFGYGVYFIPYYGESTFDMGVVDYIYSAWDQDKLDKLNIKDIFRNSPTYLGTTAYKGRYAVLSNELVKQGMVDTRVTAQNDAISTSIAALHGNNYLRISEVFFSIVNVLMSSELFDAIFDVVESLERSSVWGFAIKPTIIFLLTIAVAAFILTLARHGRKFALGSESAKEFVIRFFGGLLSLGLIYAMIANPIGLNNAVRTLVNGTDIIIGQTISLTGVGGASSSDIKESVLKSEVYETAIFEPWIHGMFGKRENGEWYDYDHLYTQYASVSEDKKYPQSHDDSHTAKEDGTKTYDSAGMTGDVWVDLGGGKQERNWAAFILSCSTKYHIANDLGQDPEAFNIDEVSFPVSRLSANNKNIYGDDFRWIDAMLNISPEYGTDGVVIPSYTDSRKYDQHFVSGGLQALWRTALLIMLMPPILEKLFAFLNLVIITFKLIFFSLLDLFKENKLIEAWNDFKTNFGKYIVASIKLLALCMIYVQLVGGDFKTQIIFIIVAGAFNIATFNDVKNTARSIRTGAQFLFTEDSTKVNRQLVKDEYTRYMDRPDVKSETKKQRWSGPDDDIYEIGKSEILLNSVSGDPIAHAKNEYLNRTGKVIGHADKNTIFVQFVMPDHTAIVVLNSEQCQWTHKGVFGSGSEKIEFAVGDTVRVLDIVADESKKLFKGRVGTIIAADSDAERYTVEFTIGDNNKRVADFNANELTPATPTE